VLAICSPDFPKELLLAHHHSRLACETFQNPILKGRQVHVLRIIHSLRGKFRPDVTRNHANKELYLIENSGL